MLACQCGSNAGPSTIYSQQKRFLDKAGIDKHPREVFQEDLINLIKRWMSEGDKIILAIDINEHILEGELSNKLLQLGLKEAISNKHEREFGLAPTCHRGQDSIDGI